jgi:hypothetical protein
MTEEEKSTKVAHGEASIPFDFLQNTVEPYIRGLSREALFELVNHEAFFGDFRETDLSKVPTKDIAESACEFMYEDDAIIADIIVNATSLTLEIEEDESN